MASTNSTTLAAFVDDAIDIIVQSYQGQPWDWTYTAAEGYEAIRQAYGALSDEECAVMQQCHRTAQKNQPRVPGVRGRTGYITRWHQHWDMRTRCWRITAGAMMTTSDIVAHASNLLETAFTEAIDRLGSDMRYEVLPTANAHPRMTQTIVDCYVNTLLPNLTLVGNSMQGIMSTVMTLVNRREARAIAMDQARFALATTLPELIQALTEEALETAQAEITDNLNIVVERTNGDS